MPLAVMVLAVIVVAMLSPVRFCSLNRLLKLRRSLVLLKRRVAADGVVEEEVGKSEGRDGRLVVEGAVVEVLSADASC